MSDQPRLAAWIDADQASMLREFISSAGMVLAAIGSPDPACASSLAADTGAATFNDQRVLIQADADVLLLCSGDTPAIDERRLIRAATPVAFSLEPLPGIVADLQAEPDDGHTAIVCPAFTRAPGFLAARDVLDGFGAVEAVSVVCQSGPRAGSCFARLYDGIAFVTRVCGVPEFIHGTLVSRIGSVPETLDGLNGHLVATMTFHGERCATVLASNQAQAWTRSASIIGPDACLHIDDAGFRHVVEDAIVDAHRAETAPSVASLIAGQIGRVIEHGDTHEPPPDHASILAQCEATRLSCRTCQPESPVTIADMLRSV
jgi:hypothetical protein